MPCTAPAAIIWDIIIPESKKDGRCGFRARPRASASAYCSLFLRTVSTARRKYSVTGAVAAFFYVRVIVLMFFSDSVGDGPTVAIPSMLTTAVITVGATVTLLLGVVPQPVLDLARQAGEFVR